MTYGKWLAVLVSSMLLAFTLIAGINALMDPLWILPWDFPFNSRQIAINEKEQKLNYLHARPGAYDSMLTGSSRATFIPERAFEGGRVFNFGISALSPGEYADVVNAFSVITGKDPAVVYLGLDFFGVSASGNRKSDMEDFLQARLKWYYDSKSLLSIDLLNYSYKCLMHHFVPTSDGYDNHNNKNVYIVPSKAMLDVSIERYKKGYAQMFAGGFQYNEQFLDQLRQLKARFPRTQFVPYTAPVTAPILQFYLDNGAAAPYFRWISEIVEVFGFVYDFMIFSPLTTDFVGKFVDGHHPMPETGAFLVQCLTGKTDGGQSVLLITRDNLEVSLGFLDRSFAARCSPLAAAARDKAAAPASAQ